MPTVDIASLLINYTFDFQSCSHNLIGFRINPIFLPLYTLLVEGSSSRIIITPTLFNQIGRNGPQSLGELSVAMAECVTNGCQLLIVATVQAILDQMHINARHLVSNEVLYGGYNAIVLVDVVELLNLKNAQRIKGLTGLFCWIHLHPLQSPTDCATDTYSNSFHPL